MILFHKLIDHYFMSISNKIQSAPIINMPKQIVIKMTDSYPFGECDDDNNGVRILVQRQINCNENNRQQKLTQCQFFRRLNQSCIVRLEQIKQQENSLQLFYEYVPIRMQQWISNINQKFIEGFCRQLTELGDYLAKCYIQVKFKIECVGMDENYRPKYFLDLDFVVDEGLNKTILRNNYEQQVLSLFMPYIQNKPTSPVFYTANRSNKGYSLKQDTNAITKYGGDRYRSDISQTSSTIRLKDKAVALQKQRKNQSINVSSNQFQMMLSNNDRNRKQSVLSSVSHVKIGRLGRRIDDIKNQLKHISAPESLYLRHQQQSVEKTNNAIAFNFDSSQRIITPKTVTGHLDSATFCKGILRDMHQEQSIFQKLQKNINQQFGRRLPLKKNQTLKVKEYQQMTQSEDGYFKDFFNVLDDKPKAIRPERKMLAIGYHPEQPRTTQKIAFSELENRVKSAINKSRTLISKFKGGDH